MPTRSLLSGHVFAGRYTLEDLISEDLGVYTWRALDETLDRSVCILAMPAADPRVDDFAAAARRSTVVTDPRFLRVLDIVDDEDGHMYLVREWARATSLSRIIREAPLANRRSATLVSELAEAIGNAHEAGVFHQRLSTRTVLVKDSGAVRVTGLALDHALLPADHDEAGLDAEQADVRALGHVLYACLTGRSPGDEPHDLRPAPTDHGRLLRPRQVRAGVSRDVDTVCDRILGTPPRHGERPLRAARDIAHVLRLAGDDESFVTDDQPSLMWSSGSGDLWGPDGPPPALNPPKRRPAALDPGPETPTTLERSRAAARQATTGDRLPIAIGIALLLVVVGALAFVVGRDTDAPPQIVSTSEPGPTNDEGTPSPVLITPSRVVDFDPEGDLEENTDLVPFATDGDLATGWQTMRYDNNPRLGLLKPGVGLVLDLGRPVDVTNVVVTFAQPGTSVQVLAAPADRTVVPTERADMTKIAATTGAPVEQTFFTPGPRTRYVAIWLTSLPPDLDNPGSYRGEIREIVVRGLP